MGRDFGTGLLHISGMNRMFAWLFALSLVMAPAFAQEAKSEEGAEKKEAASPEKPEKPVKEVAVIKTSAGEMVVEFWPEVAPKTVENFKKLAKEGFYNGTAFHRIIKGFMIQGGDPLTKDPAREGDYGTGGPGYKIPAEFNNRKHTRGVISMARGPQPDSAGSQFFIMLGSAPSLDNQYTAFGKLIKGEDVLMKIGETPVGLNRGEMSKPKQRIEVESVKIVPADSVK